MNAAELAEQLEKLSKPDNDACALVTSRQRFALLAAALRLAEAECAYDAACRSNDSVEAWPKRDTLDQEIAAYREARSRCA